MTQTPFGFDTPEDSPGYMLWQTTMIWQRLIKKALEPYQITHAQFVIMATILWRHKQNKTVTQVDIIEMTNLDKMTVSKSLRLLESKNLVKRWEHHTDTRAKMMVLSFDGEILVNTIVQKVEAVDAKFFGKLPKGQVAGLIRAMQDLTSSETASAPGPTIL